MFLFNYAFALDESGNMDRAIDKYMAALRVDPLFMQAHYNLAEIYMKKRIDQLAIDHLEQVVIIDDSRTPARLQLARLYIQQGQAGLARNHLSAILSTSPDNAEAKALWQQVRQN